MPPTRRHEADESPEQGPQDTESTPDETATKNTPGTDPVTGGPADVEAPAENPAEEAGAGQVQATFDEANEKGYFGETPDKRDPDADTLQAVTKEARDK
jgi:hypothetical protein